MDTRLTREIQALRLTFRGDCTYTTPSKRQLKALNRLLGEILTIQGKPGWFNGSATDYRREVRLEILRELTGETWILTSANLSGHVVSCLISYLKKQGASNWDVEEIGKRLILLLQERAEKRIDEEQRPAHSDGLQATLSNMQSTC